MALSIVDALHKGLFQEVDPSPKIMALAIWMLCTKASFRKLLPSPSNINALATIDATLKDLFQIITSVTFAECRYKMIFGVEGN